MISPALASDLKLEVATTEYRGHARDLAGGRWRAARVELVVVARRRRHRQRGRQRAAAPRPRPGRAAQLAVVPGGSTNVFARALGLPNDAVEATGALLDALRAGASRTVGLGLVSGTPGTEDEGVPARWFTFCAGLGFDAGVVGRVEQQRELGKRSTHALYCARCCGSSSATRTAGTARSPWSGPARTRCTGLATAIVCNTAPWTYLGNRPVVRLPRRVLRHRAGRARRHAGCPPCPVRVTRRSCSVPPRSAGRAASTRVALHDLTDFTLQSQAPLPFQVDGDHLGLRTSATFTGVRRALRVIV